jgi:hypothetical protein
MELSNGVSALIESARGCPFSCGYCLRSGFRRNLRLKPLDILRMEIDELGTSGVGYVFLIDETFGIPWSHASAVSRVVSEHGMTFGMQTRPELWSEERTDFLVEHGCVYVEAGIESSDPRALTKIDKFRAPLSALAGLQALQSRVQHVGANTFDVGNPDLKLMTTIEAESLRDFEGRKPGAFIPYPGTEWGNHALLSLGVGAPCWSHAAAAYLLYRLMGRSRPLGWTLRRSRVLRILVFRMAFILKGLGGTISLGRTRYETEIRDEP